MSQPPVPPASGAVTSAGGLRGWVSNLPRIPVVVGGGVLLVAGGAGLFVLLNPGDSSSGVAPTGTNQAVRTGPAGPTMKTSTTSTTTTALTGQQAAALRNPFAGSPTTTTTTAAVTTTSGGTGATTTSAPSRTSSSTTLATTSTTRSRSATRTTTTARRTTTTTRPATTTTRPATTTRTTTTTTTPAAPTVLVGTQVGNVDPADVNGTPLSTSVTNLGSGSIADLDVTVATLSGWTVTANDPTTQTLTSADSQLITGWTLQVPPSTPAGSYQLTVRASYKWGSGTAATKSQVVDVRVGTPPANGITDLSDLDPTAAHNASGPVEKDTSVGTALAGDGTPLTINNTVYPKGLGTAAASDLTYYLGGRCQNLSTWVGIDDEVASGGSATFTIYADAVQVAGSSALTAADPPARLDAILAGATWLRLVADPGSSLTGNDADWAAPQLTCDGTAPIQLFSFENGTAGWSVQGGNGTLGPESDFATTGTKGMSVNVTGTRSFWVTGSFGSAPPDLSSRSVLAYDVKTGNAGSSTSMRLQTGPNSAQCQDTVFHWANPNTTTTVRVNVSDLVCAQGATIDPSKVRTISFLSSPGSSEVDGVRIEPAG